MTTLATVVTWNLVFKGVVGGLITGLVAMGIVLVYRSSPRHQLRRRQHRRPGHRAVRGDGRGRTGGRTGRRWSPRWRSARSIGVLVELAVIRRLFKSPRVIVLVATIGVAQLCEAVTLSLPEYRTGSLQTQFPLPFTGTWYPGLGIEVSASQLLILIVVPVITVGLWWLLGHTAFGDAVRAAASNSDLARMTGINPKMVSTGVWAIAGFLGTVAILLTATDQVSADLVHIGPDTLLRGMAAALIGGMVSFPRAVIGAVAIGILDRVLFFNYTSETGLVQFVLFLVGAGAGGAGEPQRHRVGRRELPVRATYRGDPDPLARHLVGEANAPVHRLPRAAGRGDPAVALRQVGAAPDLGDDHRVRAVRGVGRRAHRLGWSAVARPDGVRRARRAHRRRAHPWPDVQHRLARHPHPRRRDPRHLVPVGAAPRRARSRVWSRSSSASGPSASAGCCSRSALSRSPSPRRRTSSTGRSSPPAAPPWRSPASTSVRSSSRTRTAPTTTSC